MARKPKVASKVAERSAALKRANRRTALIVGGVAVGLFMFTLAQYWQ